MLGAVLLVSGCGNKAAPFLGKVPGPVRLELTEVLVRGGQVDLTFNLPKEDLRLGKEEDPWSLARLLRRDADSGRLAYEERSVVREAASFTFGRKRTISDSGIGGKKYVYRIELRKDESGDVAESEPVEVLGESVPGIQGEVRVEGREGAIVVVWEPPKEGRKNYLYHVFRREAGQEEAVRINRVPLKKVSFIDTGIRGEDEYCYQVETYLQEGIVRTEGPLSPEGCGRSVDRTAPPAPGKLVAVFSKGEAVLTWFPVDAEDLSGYHVYRSDDGGPFLKITETVVPGARYRDSGLHEGVEYLYRVTAVDSAAGANESSFSNSVMGSAP